MSKLTGHQMETFVVASSKDGRKTYDFDMKDNQKGAVKCGSCEMFAKKMKIFSHSLCNANKCRHFCLIHLNVNITPQAIYINLVVM